MDLATVSWVTEPRSSRPSGTIATVQFPKLFSVPILNTVDQGMATRFRTFVQAMTMAYYCWDAMCVTPLAHRNRSTDSSAHVSTVNHPRGPTSTPQPVTGCDIRSFQVLFFVLGSAMNDPLASRLAKSPRNSDERSIELRSPNCSIHRLASEDRLGEILARHLASVSVLRNGPETASETRIVGGAGPRWNQIESSKMAFMGVKSNSQTPEASPETANTLQSAAAPFVAIARTEVAELDNMDVASENPQSYLRMADGVPRRVGQGMKHHPDSIIQSGFHNGAYMHTHLFQISIFVNDTHRADNSPTT